MNLLGPFTKVLNSKRIAKLFQFLGSIALEYKSFLMIADISADTDWQK
jgi:hypothetical protein